MKRTTFLASTLAFPLLVPRSPAWAELSGQPTALEADFVTTVSTYLNQKYPRASDATAAGFLRYTDVDDTGAISYANRKWISVDEKSPSQLWYDTSGKLLGADYSVTKSAAPPHLFGLQPERWQAFGAHLHYGVAGPDGTTIYKYARPEALASVGATFATATPETLVKLGKAKSASDVRFMFEFPAIWDVALWVIPNPNGAFAEKNPNVPVPASASKM